MSVAATPEMVGPYQIRRLLGSGSFGRVFRADGPTPEGPNRPVALKLLHPGMPEEERRRRQSLINEAVVLTRLRHPHIVRFLGQGTHQTPGGESLYIVLELVEGVTLREVLENASGGLPAEVAVAIALPILEALEVAHGVNTDGQPDPVIHRDLKPGNLMIDRDGAVKMLDFGVAKALFRPFQTTTAHAPKGSVPYMSPEQVSSQPLSPASDQFALGAVLYELLTGRPLFTGRQLHTVMFAVAAADLGDRLAPIDQRYPQLGDVLRRSLARDPEQRFPHARAMAAALRRALPELDLIEARRQLAVHCLRALGEADDEAASSLEESDLIFDSDVSLEDSTLGLGPDLLRPQTDDGGEDTLL